MLQTQDDSPQAPPTRPTPPRITAAQWGLLAILAAMNFSNCVDFVIMMPLGPRYLRDLHITLADFGLLVSAYGYAGALSGLLASFFIDRFDRKRALLGLYAGFTIGTLGCALAPNYETLLIARCVAGACGGVLGALILAIVGDAFPEERRGLATGVVMSAFSLAMIVGVPAGLASSRLGTTGTPFALLAGLSAICWVCAIFLLPVMRHHVNPFALPPAMWRVFLVPKHYWAFVLMISLVFGQFALIPYLPTFLEANVGFGELYLPLMYFCGGLATLGTMPIFGRLADHFGKLIVFRVLALSLIVPIVVLTHMTWSTVLLTLCVTTMFMILASGRMVPAMALITSSAQPSYRGSFMSVNGAVQQIAMGLAAQVGGLFLSQAHPGAPLVGFEVVGYLACGTTILSVILAGQLRPAGSVPQPIGEPTEEPTRRMVVEIQAASVEG